MNQVSNLAALDVIGWPLSQVRPPIVFLRVCEFGFPRRSLDQTGFKIALPPPISAPPVRVPMCSLGLAMLWPSSRCTGLILATHPHLSCACRSSPPQSLQHDTHDKFLRGSHNHLYHRAPWPIYGQPLWLASVCPALNTADINTCRGVEPLACA